MSRGSPWPQLGHLLAAGGCIHRDVSEEAQGGGSALHYVPHLRDQSGYGDATGVCSRVIGEWSCKTDGSQERETAGE